MFDSLWKPEEIDLTQDLVDWERLSKFERQFIKIQLSFFAASDGIVNENISNNFLSEVQWMEHRCFLGLQVAVENVHSETYALLIQAYVPEEVERMHLFRAVENNTLVRRKAEWAFKYMDATNSPFRDRIVAFVCVEGIFFSAAFCAIFWLKKRGLMPGLAYSNELISRDEGLHTAFGCLMYSELTTKSSRVGEIVREAVELECAFVRDSLVEPLIGMNSVQMCQYVEYVADRVMVDLGEPPIFHTANPFDWMELISVDGKTNFFEKRVGEYAKVSGSRLKRGKMMVDMDF